MPETWPLMVPLASIPTFVASLRPRGPAANAIADLWWLMLVIGTGIFLVFALLLLRALFRRGGKSPAEIEPGSSPPKRTGQGWILGGGVIMPAAVLIAIMWLTLAAMKTVSSAASAEAIAIEVIGHQWWWEINYSSHGFSTANEIHIPVGIPVELTLRSADVIHSFWVPALHGKLDALPDYPTVMVLEADEVGQYRGTCAEFCGLQHTKMGLLVIATPPDQFDAWVSQQQQPAILPSGPGQAGLDLFMTSDCSECHTIRGTGAAGDGPDLTHLANRQMIGAGTLPNEPDHLAAWITDPHASKEGVAMPATELSEEQLQALLVYLASLE